MIEVELKFELRSDASHLQKTLEALPAVSLLDESASTDTYYDTQSYDGLRRAIFLRIRNHRVLEFKFHEQEDVQHLYSDERVFPLNATPEQMQGVNTLCSRLFPGWHPAESIMQMLAVNKLQPFVCIDKQRIQYRVDDIMLCIDQVEELGTFLEIETQCRQVGEVEQAQKRLQAMVARLAPSQDILHPVSIGYVELWLRQHQPHIYRMGKYL